MGWKRPDTVEPCYCVIRSAWEMLVGCPNDPKGQDRPAGNEGGRAKEAEAGERRAGREVRREYGVLCTRTEQAGGGGGGYLQPEKRACRRLASGRRRRDLGS